MANFWEEEGHLEVEGNQLYLGGVDTNYLVKKYGSPLYVYNSDRTKENYRELNDLFEENADRNHRIHYAMKANPHPTILEMLEGEGVHLDTVSPGEAEIGLKSGFGPQRILYTGTSVSNEDMRRVLDLGVKLNIDSLSQLERLNEILENEGYSKDALKLSIRWNPGEGTGSDSKTITAGAESHGKPIKFGVPEDKVERAAKKAVDYGFNLVGLHQHIGSGWLGEEAIDSFLSTVDSTLEMARNVGEIAGGLEFVDFGGGPGIPYREEDPEFNTKRYVKGICEKVSESGLDFETTAIEPGRYIVGDSGLLLTEVNTVEEKHGNLIVGVDSGFNHLLRPGMYGAHHEVINCSRVEGEEVEGTVAGNLCETGDILATKRKMVKPEEGDVLALHNAGAYGMCMASNYNSRERPAEAAISQGEDRLITERETVKDLLSNVKV